VAVQGADGDEKRVDDDGFCVSVDVQSAFIDVKSVNLTLNASMEPQKGSSFMLFASMTTLGTSFSTLLRQ
jgi:hypothetical protein